MALVRSKHAHIHDHCHTAGRVTQVDKRRWGKIVGVKEIENGIGGQKHHFHKPTPLARIETKTVLAAE